MSRGDIRHENCLRAMCGKSEGGKMEKAEQVSYWLDTASQDYDTMKHLYDSKDYHWALFIGHLVVEKTLKAIHVKNFDESVPRTHDLLRLAKKCNIMLNDEQ